ncbi:unnamed protein product [Cylindrotheca closterium]|uniref:Uncharacterized protein n=1 Tax=Cylindrotheca closterium TaxID=2856 RepID=A0AAD2FW99_9STRA|nr:unnamed protein product [Cylindrotheca closterium]
MASRWTTAFLIVAIFGGSAFICENRKQAFGMAILLGSVAFFEMVHAVVKRLLFPDSEDPSTWAKDQESKNSTKGYVEEVPTKHPDEIRYKHPSMGTQTREAETFHDAMDKSFIFSPNKVQAAKKSPNTKQNMKNSEKRALAIHRAKQSMKEDKLKVEAAKKKKAVEMRRGV